MFAGIATVVMAAALTIVAAAAFAAVAAFAALQAVAVHVAAHVAVAADSLPRWHRGGSARSMHRRCVPKAQAISK